ASTRTRRIAGSARPWCGRVGRVRGRAEWGQRSALPPLCCAELVPGGVIKVIGAELTRTRPHVHAHPEPEVGTPQLAVERAGYQYGELAARAIDRRRLDVEYLPGFAGGQVG